VTNNPAAASKLTAISAHADHSEHARNGAIAAYRDAVATGADYVELDIRRTADQQLVAFHDARTSQGHLVSAVEYSRLCDLVGFEVPQAAEVFAVIKHGGAKGHLDLKETGDEHKLVSMALDILGPGGFIVTALEDASVAAISSRFPDPEAVPVALSLSLSGGRKGPPRTAWPQTRRSGLRPWPRLRDCGATWVAVDHRLALSGLVRRCREQHLKVMLWTVNNEREIRYWLSRGRVDVLITDRPARAIAIRGQAAPAGPFPELNRSSTRKKIRPGKKNSG
jgi:glycerophosphoryl diester phosphodiesterase